jgi:hypothetical protein
MLTRRNPITQHPLAQHETRSGRNMKYRMALWASAGFLVAGFWAIYFAIVSKDVPIDPIASTLSRVTCPIAIAGSHFPISMYWVMIANAATYALFGLVVETLRRQLNHSK